LLDWIRPVIFASGNIRNSEVEDIIVIIGI
jgi:hypothetical protein